MSGNNSIEGTENDLGAHSRKLREKGLDHQISIYEKSSNLLF